MMKSKWIIVAAALALMSCVREPEAVEPATPSGVEGEKVSVHFTMRGSEPISPNTKVLDDGGSLVNADLQNLYLAVFGSSGYLKEYVKADLDTNPDGSIKIGQETVSVQKQIIVSDKTDPDYGKYKIITVSHTVPVYSFTARLTIAESPRTVHLIGNGPEFMPFGYDTAVLPVRMSQLNQGLGEKAYWQMIDLPNGIRPKRNSKDNIIDKDGHELQDSDPNKKFEFVIDPRDEARFQNISLIRNWAKILLYADPAEDSNFTPHSLAVVNFPSRGAIVPYSAQTGFIRGYEELDFEELQNMKYPANLPAGTTFDSSMPKIDYFKKPAIDPSTGESNFKDGDRVALAYPDKASLDAAENDAGHAVYLYERPEPTESVPPTYVIVYGHYRNEENEVISEEVCDICGKTKKYKDEGNYFYKVDLMETVHNLSPSQDQEEFESRYYPIYRNFKYQIKITQILSKGYDTPEGASKSAGSADVSADITTGHLSEISDGVGRLHLTKMSYNFIDENDHPVEDLHVYYSQAADGKPDLNDENISVRLLDAEDGGPDIIYNLTKGDVEKDKDASNYGWRPIFFSTVAPGKTIRSQAIRITGIHRDANGKATGRLYRDVVVTVQPVQEMKVECDNKVIDADKDENQVVTISIPEGLVSSMFPLEFYIEAQDLTLTPTEEADNNLPVRSGTSIVDISGMEPAQAQQYSKYVGKTSFQFVKTLTWEDYQNNEKTTPYRDDHDRQWRSFKCKFKTNCDHNETTVWVASKYFDTAHDDFSNRALGTLSDGAIPAEVPQEGNVSIPFAFRVQKDESGNWPTLTLTVRGLINDRDKNITEGNNVINTNDPTVYTFTPSDNENKLYFRTTGTGGDISVQITARNYNTLTIKPYRFNKDKPSKSYGFLNGIQFKMTGNGNDAGFWSNVAFGRVQRESNSKTTGRGVIFGYYEDPDYPNKPTPIRITDATDEHKYLTTSANSNNSGLYLSTHGGSPSSFANYVAVKERDSSGDATYHEINMSTNGSPNTPVAIQLHAVGYVTETFINQRLTAQKTRIHSYYVTTDNINAWSSVDASSKILTLTPQVSSSSVDESYFTVTIQAIGENTPAPMVVAKKGIYLGVDPQNVDNVLGGTYRLTMKSGDIDIQGSSDDWKNQRFFFSGFNIPKDNLPKKVTPTEGHQYFKYDGNATFYSWVAFKDDTEYKPIFDPTTTTTKSIEFEVGTDHSMLISGFSYKAVSDYFMGN